MVSDFPYLTNTNDSNVFRHRVYAQPSLIDSAELGLIDGERILSSIANYVNISFSLPKMDQVAIPAFGPGGM